MKAIYLTNSNKFFVQASFKDFFFKPARAEPLALFRIGLSLILLWQAFLLHDSFLNFFAGVGFVQREVIEQLIPNFNWLIALGNNFNLSESLILKALGILYIGSLLFFLCGFFSNTSALIVWFLHWSFANTGYSGAYGADMYAHIFLFYFIFIPSGDAFSFDRLLKRNIGQPSYQARLGLRVLQLHMCISYLASGLEKASALQWWNGEVIYRAFNTPGYSIVDFHWLAEMPAIPMLMGWATLATEILYCIMIWPQKTRFLWVLATCSLHIGIAIFLRLPVFGLLMCVPTIALFAIPAEPDIKEA